MRTIGRRHRLFHTAVIGSVLGLALVTGCTDAAEQAGPGVTDAPCPQALDESKGCIYLGVLSDLADGPFTALGSSIHDGQRAFWHAVNAAGGIAGREVDISTYARNTGYDPQRHRAEYARIEPHVLALAMSFGTAQTMGVLPEMEAAGVVTGAGTLWSGWQYPDTDRNLVLDYGFSYCAEAVLGLDWFSGAHYLPSGIGIVAYRGNYGGDYASGAMRWAAANGIPVTARIDTGPNSEVGNQDGPVATILASKPDVVVLATGPVEAAEIIGKLVAGGYEGRFLGSTPTWNSALLRTPAAEAITALYNYTSPFDGWDGHSAGAAKARAATTEPPANWGYNLGWATSYPMKELLTAAAAQGPLTRAALRRALSGLTVDSEGMAPQRRYGTDRPDLAAERAVISVPDPDAPLGSRTLAADYRGPTLERITFSGPCARL
ncbi:ABC transporter substrate-binding protein [Nocardia farcinica]|uniref:Leucine-binding protein domain-containing protein n=1 Tax=Nocardia farcinica TaxID=37329 RepID=A0A0H5P7M8_NOCFR|nr:ABC transporter substrate-binding protein [Nocardia farcinica]AXK88170.1 hypothetical protein DXT66_23370 [Nocardia farcinica]MBA4854790.1 ABC transporter substrate-binding protein [Nocardia farcinica]MBC9815047.1 ABC transporter substrate-binding protein [Nocardia farcinica]MBF6253541.1 ABC transporter substrate-binding protein [Nocardia farcinica]MBF6265251.1 ABC transporter substrate-binding protein [Nocardia farcinica]